VRTLLADRGYSLASAERAAELHRGYLSRLLSGRRGWPSFEAVVRLSDATEIPFGHLAEAFRWTIEAAWKLLALRKAAEQARIDAERF
jgi:transcriptional regulator with XRE-family HTH domain